RVDPRAHRRGPQPREGARRSHGPPPALTRHQREEALAALAEGSATQADLARRFNVSRSTISRL
ncbi:helix-turn-helix domain-containing protein, partial [Methylosinus sp. H3A]|uniref:helix-turn-helix domain-containing protein n=1 Tax=Methylosinus sp. H3A TaxID=2785786 RepID=UPI0018C323EB|nr:helix-turn-helix domain-containing protein [Methylosinus sp. H3A]